MDNYQLGFRVSIVTVGLNVFLAIVKLIAGTLANSSAMLADGVHTLSDVFTTLVVLVGLKVSSKRADDDHQYGHERFESIFAKILSLILLGTGLFIGYNAIGTLRSGNIVTPGKLALGAAVFSIITKEVMYRYTIVAAKAIRSLSMEADAWHHRSDALSSIGTFIGILGARMGIPALDPIAGIVVAIMIIKVGLELYLESVSQLVDEAASDEIVKEICKIANSVDGVRNVNDLKTRISGSRIFVDMSIYVDPDISVKEGHDISVLVHDRLEKQIKDIKHCMIHIEPYEREKRSC